MPRTKLFLAFSMLLLALPLRVKAQPPRPPKRLNDRKTPSPLPKLGFLRGDGKPGLIVFVHGFLGKAEDTWTNKKAQSYWPSMLLTDHTLDAFDVYVHQFDSHLFRDDAGIIEVVDALQRTVQSEQFFQRYNNIVFVCHSMGGLVVRNLVKRISVSEGGGDNVRRVKALYLFGTPANGAKIADFLSLIPLVGNRQLPALRSLEDNPWLREEQDAWRKSDTLQNVPVYCAYETQKVGKILVVSQESAQQPCSRFVTSIVADHIQMVKPADKKAPAYVELVLAIRRMRKDPPVAPRKALNSGAPSADRQKAGGPSVGSLEAFQGKVFQTIEAGDFAAAGELLRDRTAPMSAEWALFSEAILRFNRGDYDGSTTAISTLRASPRVTVRHSRALDFLSALISFQKRQINQAEKNANAAIKAGIENGTIYFVRGWARTRIAGDMPLGEVLTALLNDAISDLSMAQQLSPGDARVFAWRGRAYDLKRDFLAGTQDAMDAATLFGECKGKYSYSECAMAFNNLGYGMMRIVLDNGGSIDRMRDASKKAEPILTKALELDPEHSHALVNRAWARNNLAAFEDAVNDATRAIRLMTSDPNLYYAYKERVTALRGLRRFEEAMRDEAEAKKLKERVPPLK